MKHIFIFFFLCISSFVFSTDFKYIDGINVLHTSYIIQNGNKLDSNGLLVKSSNGYILFDTAWDLPQTKEIIEYVTQKLKSKIVACIVTHAHEDRIAGIPVLLENKIDVYSTELTRSISKKNGYPLSNKTIEPRNINIDGIPLVIMYYGPGHAPDNIIIAIDKYKILYTACLVKALNNKTLGNIADADINNWKVVLQKLLTLYKNKNYFVIPGHGSYGSEELIKHTLNLF